MRPCYWCQVLLACSVCVHERALTSSQPSSLNPSLQALASVNVGDVITCAFQVQHQGRKERCLGLNVGTETEHVAREAIKKKDK